MNTKLELFVAGITLMSVIVIIYVYLEQPTGITLDVIYTFDLIVVIILIFDFYYTMKESKEGPGDTFSYVKLIDCKTVFTSVG